jgi:hypothetical protein
MDSSEVSIDAAAQIAKDPVAEQKHIVELPKPERKAAVARLRKRPAPHIRTSINTARHAAHGATKRHDSNDTERANA